MLFTPGSYNCSPARQKGPFKLCSALRVTDISAASTPSQHRFQGLIAVCSAAFARLVEYFSANKKAPSNYWGRVNDVDVTIDKRTER